MNNTAQIRNIMDHGFDCGNVEPFDFARIGTLNRLLEQKAADLGNSQKYDGEVAEIITALLLDDGFEPPRAEPPEHQRGEICPECLVEIGETHCQDFWNHMTTEWYCGECHQRGELEIDTAVWKIRRTTREEGK